ncbi:IclR family transcriptional regulator [Sphingomonas bacterium]|uniref:IclR family transcriptional regulator n=1 Tax=Sphingomonas bacterium TaxID=1895847 RepID=UPI0015759D83|nr:IclR family transcriptional regulator C-terminal domain-containing protein [Sphingomonas bacterium]
MLAVLEQIANRQPVGVSELARSMEEDKSAVQRAILTLADEGWIDAAPGASRRWQLTGHIHLVAHVAHARSGLRQRALPILTKLRDQTGETVALSVPDVGRFVLIEVLESREVLRTAPYIGMVVLTRESATGRAVLPYLTAARQAELLGGTADPILAASFEETLRNGFAVNETETDGNSINIAAPIFEVDHRPIGAVVLSAPRSRLAPEAYQRIGMLVLQAARELSGAATAAVPPIPQRDDS